MPHGHLFEEQQNEARKGKARNDEVENNRREDALTIRPSSFLSGDDQPRHVRDAALRLYPGYIVAFCAAILGGLRQGEFASNVSCSATKRAFKWHGCHVRPFLP